MNIQFLAALVLAGIVFWRIGNIAYLASRARFGCGLRFQGFAFGYALLGLGVFLVLIDAWDRSASLSALAMLTASALLTVFDRRNPTP